MFVDGGHIFEAPPEFFFVYFGTKTTQINWARENLQDRKRRMKRDSQLDVWPRSSQSGAEKQLVGSETPEHGVKIEQ